MNNNDQMPAFSEVDKLSTRRWLNTSALSSLLFGLSFVLNGYFNGCFISSTQFCYYRERVKKKVKRRWRK